MRSSGPLTDLDREAIRRFSKLLTRIGPQRATYFADVPAWKRYEIRLAAWQYENDRMP